MLSEIILRRRFDTVNFPAERKTVQIFLQDPFLAVELFQPPEALGRIVRTP